MKTTTTKFDKDGILVCSNCEGAVRYGVKKCHHCNSEIKNPKE